jgi:uncharacterized membrane protein YhaH (DUF805 family)
MIESYKKYWSLAFTTKGRTTRYEYWMAWLATFIISFIIGFIMGLSQLDDSTVKTVARVWELINFIPGISITARRYHDINRSGWWMFVPIVNFIFTLLPSVDENNKY